MIMNRKRLNIGNYISLIILIGILSSLFTSDIPFGAIFQRLVGAGSDLEFTLDTVNLWLGFLAFGVLIFLAVFLLTREQLPPSFREIFKEKGDDEDEDTFH